MTSIIICHISMQGIFARPTRLTESLVFHLFSESPAMEVSCVLRCTFSLCWNLQGSVRLKKECSIWNIFIHILRTEKVFIPWSCVYITIHIILTPNITQTNTRLKNISQLTHGAWRAPWTRTWGHLWWLRIPAGANWCGIGKLRLQEHATQRQRLQQRVTKRVLTRGPHRRSAPSRLTAMGLSGRGAWAVLHGATSNGRTRDKQGREVGLLGI